MKRENDEERRAIAEEKVIIKYYQFLEALGGSHVTRLCLLVMHMTKDPTCIHKL